MIAIISAIEDEIRYFASRSVVDRTEEIEKVGVLIYCRISDRPVLLASGGKGVSDIAAIIEKVMALDDIDEIIFAGQAKALVPYLQAGDFVVANRILPYSGNPKRDNNEAGEVLAKSHALMTDTTIADRLADAYSQSFDGHSNRPELVIGGIISGEAVTADRIAAARLYRDFGVVAADREGLDGARQCQNAGIAIVTICTIVDNFDQRGESQTSFTRSKYADLYTILAKYLDNRGGRDRVVTRKHSNDSAAIPVHVAIPKP